MIDFCSAVQTSIHIGLCLKYRFWVDFKIESVLFLIITSEGHGKQNFIMIDSYEEMGAATVDSRWLKIWRGARLLLGWNTKAVQDNESLSYQIWISNGFALVGTSERVWPMECLQWGFVWSLLIYGVFMSSRVNYVYGFDFFPSFSSSVMVKVICREI